MDDRCLPFFCDDGAMGREMNEGLDRHRPSGRDIIGDSELERLGNDEASLYFRY